MINSISADTVELRILVFVGSVYMEPDLTNQLFRALSRFAAEQIKLM